MAIISPNTFDPLKRYIAVRLQQGVPIVDADWNELEDVRKFELRSFLKWYVGDGTPEGAEGFKIVGDATADDFNIQAGAPALPGGGGTIPNTDKGLAFVGRYLVDGVDVIIGEDPRVKNQPLHTSKAGSAALAAAWGVPVVSNLPAVNDTGIVIYLDVWDRLVTPTEDPNLVPPGLGTESCARFKREWVVRWRTSPTVSGVKTMVPPQRGDSDYQAGHSYTTIASIVRRTSNGAVLASDVTDRRTRRLLVPPATLVEDTLGGTLADYRRGLNRPAISLREALNATLRGELPSKAPAAVSPTGGKPLNYSLFTSPVNGRIGAVWQSDVSGVNQLQMSVHDGTSFPAPTTIGPGATVRTSPSVAILPNGDHLVAHELGTEVHYLRFSNPAAPGSSNLVATGVSRPVVAVTGDHAVFFFATATAWQYRRLRHTDNVWLDAAPVAISVSPAGTTSGSKPHATVDTAGRVVFAFRIASGSTESIFAANIHPTSGLLWSVLVNSTSAAVPSVHVVPLASQHTLVFYSVASLGQGQMLVHRLDQNGGTFSTGSFLGLSNQALMPAAAVDAQGSVWLYTTGSGNLFCLRYDPDASLFSSPFRSQLSTGTGLKTNPIAILAADKSTYVAYVVTDVNGVAQSIQYKQLFTVL